MLYRQAAMLALARLTTAASSFGVLAVAARYLDTSDFAFFALVTTAYGVLGLTDFGLGYGAQYNAAGRDVSEKVEIFRRSIRMVGLACLPALAVVLLLAGISKHPFVASVALTLGLATVPLNFVDRWRTQQQEAGVSAGYSAVGAVVGLLATIAAAELGAGSAITVVPIACVALTQAVHAQQLCRRLARSSLAPVATVLPSSKKLARRGLVFFVGQLSAVALFQYDLFIVGIFAGPAEVGHYAVITRIVIGGSAVLGAVTSAFFPHISESGSHSLKRNLRRVSVFMIAIIASLLCFAVLALADVFGPPLRAAFGTAVAPDSSKVSLAFVFLASFVLANGLTYIASALHLLRTQLMSSLALIIVKIVVSPLAMIHAGTSFLLAASSIVIIAAGAVPLYISIRRKLISTNDSCHEPSSVRQVPL